MKICLAKTPVYPQLNRELDLSLIVSAAIYSLATIAREKGHDVTVADPAVWDERGDWRDSLLTWLDPDADIVGFSCHSFNWALTRLAVTHLKRLAPEKIVVIGGVHPTHRPRHVMESSPADFAIQGEGEAPFSALLDALACGGDISQIPGLCWRDNTKVVLNAPTPPPELRNTAQALPAYDLIPAEKYTTLTVETSRGCRGSCAFCSIPSRRHWRPFSPEDSFERIRRGYETGRPNVVTDCVYLSDDCFTADRWRAVEICGRIADSGLAARLSIEARVNDLLDSELRQALGRIRVHFIQIGVECGYERGLKLVSKGTTVERVRACAESLHKDGLHNAAMMSFIIGLPWEDEADCMATLQFAADLMHETGIGINTSWWVPIPSQLWERRAEFGIDLPDDIFDSVGWTRDQNIVGGQSPRLDQASKLRLEDRFATYEALGLPLRRRFPTLMDLDAGGGQ